MDRVATLPSGEKIPALGQGTWQMAESRAKHSAELQALRRGIELGLTLIDTAEMYGEGNAESLVGEALAGLREKIFLVSKVYPQNASRAGVIAACERSLKRLGTDRLDLYLLHWRGSHPLSETIAGFEALCKSGHIRHWGVSNFDTEDMEELFAAGGGACATNQILYNVMRRGPEWDLIPWLSRHRMPVMAYSPFEQGRLRTAPLRSLAEKHGVTPYQIALAWLLAQPNVFAVPKASSVRHVEDNRKAADIVLSEPDLAAIDAAFKPPSRKRALDSL